MWCFVTWLLLVGKQWVSEPWTTQGILAAPAQRSLVRRATLAIPPETPMAVVWVFSGIHRRLTRQKAEDIGEGGKFLSAAGPVPRAARLLLE